MPTSVGISIDRPLQWFRRFASIIIVHFILAIISDNVYPVSRANHLEASGSRRRYTRDDHRTLIGKHRRFYDRDSGGCRFERFRAVYVRLGDIAYAVHRPHTEKMSNCGGSRSNYTKQIIEIKFSE